MSLIQTSKKVYKEVINETLATLPAGVYLKLVGVSTGFVASVDVATSQSDNIIGYTFKPIPPGQTSSVIVFGESTYAGSFTGYPLNSPLTLNISGVPILGVGASKVLGYNGTSLGSGNRIFIDCRGGNVASSGVSQFEETTLSNQNDYSLNFNNHIIFREAINITGIVFDVRKTVTLSFIPTVPNTNAVVLQDANVSSAVNNQFAFGSDFNILQNESVTLFYDPTLLKWKIESSSPKYREYSFVAVTSQVINHNFGKYPVVEFIDASGLRELLEVQHNSKNQVTITATLPVTGTLILTGA
jgi:hypothetical protein